MPETPKEPAPGKPKESIPKQAKEQLTTPQKRVVPDEADKPGSPSAKRPAVTHTAAVYRAVPQPYGHAHPKQPVAQDPYHVTYSAGGGPSGYAHLGRVVPQAFFNRLRGRRFVRDRTHPWQDPSSATTGRTRSGYVGRNELPPWRRDGSLVPAAEVQGQQQGSASGETEGPPQQTDAPDEKQEGAIKDEEEGAAAQDQEQKKDTAEDEKPEG